jgi:hypothetical protein
LLGLGSCSISKWNKTCLESLSVSASFNSAPKSPSFKNSETSDPGENAGHPHPQLSSGEIHAENPF